MLTTSTLASLSFLLLSVIFGSELPGMHRRRRGLLLASRKNKSLWIAVLTLIPLALGATYFFVCAGARQYQKMATRLLASNLPPGYYQIDGEAFVPVDHGRWQILRASPALVTVDTGGGHLGARGYIFSEHPAALDELQSYFAESIVFEPVNEKVWSYVSSEE